MKSPMLTFFDATLFFLIPIYAFRSGGFQLADLLLVPLGVYLMTRRGLCRQFWADIGRDLAFQSIWILIFFMVISLCAHNLFLNAPFDGLQVESAYFAFLFYAVLLFFYRLFNHPQPQKIVNTICYLIAASTIGPLVSAAQLFTSGRIMFRQPLTFNNPNQLGIYAGLCTSILVLSYLVFYPHYSRRMKLFLTVVLLALLTLMILSGSRAALFGVFNYLALAIHYVKTARNGKRNMVIFIAALTLILIPVVKEVMRPENLKKIVVLDRLTNNESENLDSDVSSRAGHIISELSEPSILLLGTGKIRTSVEGLEVHNDFLGLIYQTGIISGILFVIACVGILMNLYRQKSYHVLTFLPYIAFGLFHYTFRPRIVWVFLAFFILLSKIRFSPPESIALP